MNNKFLLNKFYGVFLISGGTDHLIKIWDLNTFKLKRVFSGHESWLCNLFQLCDYDKNILISASLDGYIKFWDFSTGVCKRSFNTESKYIAALTPLRTDENEFKFAIGTSLNMIQIYDFKSNEIVKVFGQDSLFYLMVNGLPKCINCIVQVEWNKNRSTIATVHLRDKFIHFWNYETGELLKSVKAFNSSGRYLFQLEGAEETTLLSIEDKIKFWSLHA